MGNKRSVALVVALLSSCGGGSEEAAPCDPGQGVRLVGPALPESAPARSTLAVTVESPGECLPLRIEVEGGGRIDPVPPPETREASFTWTLGRVPIPNTLRFPGEVQATVVAVLDPPLVPAEFGEVDAFLASEGIAGSTEGLAFDPARDRIVMGVPGGLIEVDAKGRVTRVPLTGDTLVAPLGLAFDHDGVLWVADGQGAALRKVLPGGEVVTVAGPGKAVEPRFPNSVAVDRDGTLVLTDTCGGKAYWIRADGAFEASSGFTARLTGGPNGVAIGPDGVAWFTTENTALLCGDGTDPAAAVGGLYRSIERGGVEAIVPGVAQYGDGVAIDHEGNIYAVFDTIESFSLKESAVWVLPRTATPPLQRLLSRTDLILANLAFGRGEFGDTTLYVALIAIPPITPASARGLVRAEVGMRGH